MFDLALQGIRDTGGTTLVMSGDRAEGQLLPKLYAEPMIAGRGRIARRGRHAALVQVAHFASTPADAAPAPTPTQKPSPTETPPPTDAPPLRRRRREQPDAS